MLGKFVACYYPL